MLPSVEGFWRFVDERERIRLRKERGDNGPWTKDPVLAKYHFCNIRREDDYGTRWYLEHVADKLHHLDNLWRTMFYRLINNIEWFEGIGGIFEYYDWIKDRRYWQRRIMRAPKPHSKAYIILAAPNPDSRAVRLVRVLDDIRDQYPELVAAVQKAETLEEVWKVLQQPYGMGPFISLQVMRDLLLVGALPFDENDFTYLGPGARLGLAMLNAPTNWKTAGSPSYADMYLQCEELRKRQPTDIQPSLVLGDVEHCLCEYAKAVKFNLGEGRRRYYRPTKVSVP